MCSAEPWVLFWSEPDLGIRFDHTLKHVANMSWEAAQNWSFSLCSNHGFPTGQFPKESPGLIFCEQSWKCQLVLWTAGEFSPQWRGGFICWQLGLVRAKGYAGTAVERQGFNNEKTLIRQFRFGPIWLSSSAALNPPLWTFPLCLWQCGQHTTKDLPFLPTFICLWSV